MVQLVPPDSLLFASRELIRRGSALVVPPTRVRPLVGTWRAANCGEPPLSMADILPYLTDPPGAQLQLPFAVA